MCVYTEMYAHRQRPEEGVGGVTGGCQSPICWDPDKLGPLEEQSVLLSAEASPQPLGKLFKRRLDDLLICCLGIYTGKVSIDES